MQMRSETDLRRRCCCQWEGAGEGAPLWRSLPLTLTLMCQLPQMIMRGWTLKKKKKVQVPVLVPLMMKYRWQLHMCVCIQEAVETNTAHCNACKCDQHISQQSHLCVCMFSASLPAGQFDWQNQLIVLGVRLTRCTLYKDTPGQA